MGRSDSGMPLKRAMASAACSTVAKRTVPQPLERPVSAWHTASAAVTAPTWTHAAGERGEEGETLT